LEGTSRPAVASFQANVWNGPIAPFSGDSSTRVDTSLFPDAIVGAILNARGLTMSNCTIAGNSGIGIFNYNGGGLGTVTVCNSIIAQNQGGTFPDPPCRWATT
jgi:hypothetical protein